MPQCRKTGAGFNPVFTRVVNHCVTVLGVRGMLTAPERERRVGRVGCIRLLKWNMSDSVAKKPLLGNILRRFGRFWPGDACRTESGFVNHAPLTFRISLS